MSLSPWDLSGISFDFGLYRPRRASYLYATQISRRRNESYRHATKSDSTNENGFDFIESMAAKKRKASYRRAIGQEVEIDQDDGKCDSHTCLPPVTVVVQDEEGQATPAVVDDTDTDSRRSSGTFNVNAIHDHVDLNLGSRETPSPAHSSGHGGSDVVEDVFSVSSDREGGIHGGCGEDPDNEEHRDPVELLHSQWQCRRNLIVLTISFILVFTAFRSIQNLQSSLNAPGRLGVIAMGCVHATMFLTCLFAPVLINKLTAKWTIVLGLLFYLFWIAANFFPYFYTLIPTSIGVGFGQSLAWGAQVTYINKMASDYAHLSKEVTQHELYKFNGIFLAFFQTSHIWGNLVSSLMLASNREPFKAETQSSTLAMCGVYDLCEDPIPTNTSAMEKSPSNSVLKLMGSYLVFAFTGFVMVLVFLERIGAKSDPEKSCLQMVWNNLKQLTQHNTYRLLIPLLIFNGFEQGFVYADYNKSYISCSIGKEYVGYNMITLGMTNSICSVLVGVVARHIPREAIVGVAGILHIGLLVFLLVWIPDQKLTSVFFIISALWGVCDAMWQTQCNCLVNLSCPDDHKTAFQNFRMLQGLGAASAFILGALVCVAVKLYIIISLLIISILFYVVAEYRLRNTRLRPSISVTVEIHDSN